MTKHDSPEPGADLRLPKSGTLEDNVGVRVLRLADVFVRLAKIGVEGPFGLRSTDLRILNTLDGMDSVSVNEIARRTHVDKAWISRSVRELEGKGLIARQRKTGDSRRSLIALTAAGRALLDRIRPLTRQSELKVLDGIDEATFKRDCDTLLRNIEVMLDRAEGRGRG